MSVPILSFVSTTWPAVQSSFRRPYFVLFCACCLAARTKTLCLELCYNCHIRCGDEHPPNLTVLACQNVKPVSACRGVDGKRGQCGAMQSSGTSIPLTVTKLDPALRFLLHSAHKRRWSHGNQMSVMEPAPFPPGSQSTRFLAPEGTSFRLFCLPWCAHGLQLCALFAPTKVCIGGCCVAPHFQHSMSHMQCRLSWSQGPYRCCLCFGHPHGARDEGVPSPFSTPLLYRPAFGRGIDGARCGHIDAHSGRH